MAKKKSKTELKPKVVNIPIQKYFQLKNPPIHKYTRAYYIEEYRGIMKEEKEWMKELEKHNS